MLMEVLRMEMIKRYRRFNVSKMFEEPISNLSPRDRYFILKLNVKQINLWK